MTLATTQRRISYDGDGSTLKFSFPYPFFAPSDIRVRLENADGSLVSPQPQLNGGATYDYYVDGSQDPLTGEYTAGALLVFNTAIAGGLELVLLRAAGTTQQLALSANGRFPAKSVEASFDRAMMVLQDLDGRVDYTLRANEREDDSLNPLPPPPARANQVLGFDAAGQPEVLDKSTLGGGSGSGPTMTNRLGLVGSYTVNSIGSDNLAYVEFDTSAQDGVILFDPANGAIADGTELRAAKTSAAHDLFLTTDGVIANALEVRRTTGGLWTIRKVGNKLVWSAANA